MSKYKFHYVYRITNIKENKHYYGARSTNLEPKDDIGFKYFSSSSDKEFKREQEEKPFLYNYKVVKIFETRKEATGLEIKLHNYFDVAKNPNFYNKAKQNSTGWDTSGISFTMSEESKEKIKENHWSKSKDRNKISEKISKALIGKLIAEETKEKISQTNLGKKHSEETLIKLRNKSPETLKRMSDAAKGRIPWNKGKTDIYSDETKEKIRQGVLGYKHTEEAKLNMSKAQKGKTFSVETRKKIGEANKGIKRTDEWNKKTSEAKSGTTWFVNSNNETICCFSNDERLKSGEWHRGRKWRK